VVVIQNTGLLESGDALRGTAVRMAVPLLTLVTWRGYGRLRPAPGAPPATEDLLVRADLDSTGILTEPTLDAWRIPHAVYASDADVGVLRTLWDGAHREGRPAALLLPRRLVRTC
jgi:sulfopyruvate decarboxylase TPP-binding subunit